MILEQDPLRQRIEDSSNYTRIYHELLAIQTPQLGNEDFPSNNRWNYGLPLLQTPEFTEDQFPNTRSGQLELTRTSQALCNPGRNRCANVHDPIAGESEVTSRFFLQLYGGNQAAVPRGRTQFSNTNHGYEESCTPRPRWCPTLEQIQLLESVFNSGTTTPSREMIVDIAARLRQFGNIAEANVFYWFQNRKARAKRRLQVGAEEIGMMNKKPRNRARRVFKRRSCGNSPNSEVSHSSTSCLPNVTQESNGVDKERCGKETSFCRLSPPTEGKPIAYDHLGDQQETALTKRDGFSEVQSFSQPKQFVLEQGMALLHDVSQPFPWLNYQNHVMEPKVTLSLGFPSPPIHSGTTFQKNEEGFLSRCKGSLSDILNLEDTFQPRSFMAMETLGPVLPQNTTETILQPCSFPNSCLVTEDEASPNVTGSTLQSCALQPSSCFTSDHVPFADTTGINGAHLLEREQFQQFSWLFSRINRNLPAATLHTVEEPPITTATNISELQSWQDFDNCTQSIVTSHCENSA